MPEPLIEKTGRGGKRTPGPGKKLGRTPKAAGEAKTRHVSIYLRPEMGDWVDEQARREPCTTSEFIERVLTQYRDTPQIL